jgi:3-hydroxypropanoate dehydrogenase
MTDTKKASQADIDLLFLDGRTHGQWLDRPVPDDLLRRLYELARMPPTSANSQPMRVVFARSVDAKERLRPTLSAGNVDKTMKAPVTAILAYDVDFPEKMPKLFPSFDWKPIFAGMTASARERSAVHSSSLQAGYFILAARALGLDCGPMGGFDSAKVDAAFFPDGKWKSTLLVNLGYGDAAKLHPRNPRLDFDEACRIE